MKFKSGFLMLVHGRWIFSRLNYGGFLFNRANSSRFLGSRHHFKVPSALYHQEKLRTPEDGNRCPISHERGQTRAFSPFNILIEAL